jgi:hypothetical protein
MSTGVSGKTDVVIHFTSMSREVEIYLGTQLKNCSKVDPSFIEPSLASELSPEQPILH